MDRAVQVMIDPDERRRARRRAAEQGLTLPEYISRLIKADLDSWEANTDESDPSAIIPVATENPPDHDGMYIGEAVAARMNRTPEQEP